MSKARRLYDLLEKQIVPLFYARNVDNVPREWIARMKSCMRKLVPVFNTNRQVREYTEHFYLPAHERGGTLGADSLKRSIALANAKDTYHRIWNGIKVVGVHTSGNGHYKVGDTLQVEALVDLPQLDPKDVAVQLYAGNISGTGEIEKATPVVMEHTRQMGPSRYLFTGKISCQTSGRQGFAVRVLPGNEDLATPFEPGLITWN